MTAQVRRLPTDALTPDELRAIRALMATAFGTGDEAFNDDDWAHALGGLHFVLDLDGAIVSHASVVERTIEIGGRPLRAGYVEAVATAPNLQGQGHGSIVMGVTASQAGNAIARPARRVLVARPRATCSALLRWSEDEARPMQSQSTAGHHLEVLFTDNGRTVEINVDDRGAGMIADTLVEAIGKDDPGEAERLIQAGVASAGGVEQVR